MSLTFFILKHLTYIHRKCAVVRTLTCVKWTDWWKMILSLALQWVAVSWGIYDIIRWATLECQYSNFIIFSAPMNIVRWTSSLAMPFCHWMTALIGREGFWGLIFQRGLTTETLLRVRNSEAILLQCSVLTLRVKSPQFEYEINCHQIMGSEFWKPEWFDSHWSFLSQLHHMTTTG